MAPPVPAKLADIDLLFRGFADPTRIRILNLLVVGELCVCDLVTLLGLPQSTVSRHLKYLQRAGLVTATRTWKFAHYQLAEPAVPIQQTLIECVRTCFRGIPQLERERSRARLQARARVTDPC